MTDRLIDTLVIHCAYTTSDMNIGVAEIDRWHKARGWDGIGYHFVIRRDGTLETGRDIQIMGAHVAGHNEHSIGLCLVGGKGHDGKWDCNFTYRQWRTLSRFVDYYTRLYNPLRVVGHRDLDSDKECPCFDVGAWMSTKSKEV